MIRLALVLALAASVLAMAGCSTSLTKAIGLPGMATPTSACLVIGIGSCMVQGSVVSTPPLPLPAEGRPQ